MKKTVVGITVVGKDREGIVATFTNFAFSRGGNIEKVNQNVIKNLFGMYLEVSFSKKVDVKKFDIENSKLELDIRKTTYLDYDIVEILEDFIIQAKNKNINIYLKSERGDIENPASFIEFFKLKKQSI